jgi:hypothetical protein
MNVLHIASIGKYNVLLWAQAFKLGKLHPPLLEKADIILGPHVTCFD